MTTSTLTEIPSTLSTPQRHAEQVAELVTGWLDLWNGDLAQAERVVHLDFCTHAAMTGGGDGSAVDSPQAWPAGSLARVLRSPTCASACRSARSSPGTTSRCAGEPAAPTGGIPGATAPAGTPAGTAVDFTGADVLRVADGRLAEHWVNSDTALMLSQLGALG